MYAGIVQVLYRINTIQYLLYTIPYRLSRYICCSSASRLLFYSTSLYNSEILCTYYCIPVLYCVTATLPYRVLSQYSCCFIVTINSEYTTCKVVLYRYLVYTILSSVPLPRCIAACTVVTEQFTVRTLASLK